MPNEISVVFHNRSNYDYHFIISEFANEFKGQFECLGENTEKYKTWNDDNEDITTVSYKIKFIDTARFMASSLCQILSMI